MPDTVHPREYFGFDACDDSKPFIFVSYAHSDAEKIAPYLRFLSENGVNLWYDNGLKPGQKWLEMLLTKIAQPTCMAVMFFLSGESVGSPFVRAETEQAFKNKKPIYGVYLEGGVVLDVEMNAYISRIQSTFIPRHESVDSAREEILAAAGELMKGQAPVSAAGYSGLYDEECRRAELLLSHTRFDGTHDRLDDARAIYRSLSQRDMTDHRGWLGLFRCECLEKPATPEEASERIKAALDYHSYAVNCADTPELRQLCTEHLDGLRTEALALFRPDACSSSEEVRALAARLPDSRMLRHVSPSTTAGYTDLSARLSARAEELARQEEEQRRAQLAAEEQKKAEALRAQEREQKAAKAQERIQRGKQALAAAWRVILSVAVCALGLILALAAGTGEYFRKYRVIGVTAVVILCAVYIFCVIVNHRNNKLRPKRSGAKWTLSLIGMILSVVMMLGVPIYLAGHETVWIDGVGYGVNYDDNSTAMICGISSGMEEFTVPASVMGAEVTSCYLWHTTPNLLRINVDPESRHFSSVDGVLFNKDQTTLVSFPTARAGSYIVPETVTSIKADAFSQCGGLTSVTVPDSVTSIGIYAFHDCPKLTVVCSADSYARQYCEENNIPYSENWA